MVDKDKKLDSSIINDLTNNLADFMDAQERKNRRVIENYHSLTKEQIQAMLVTAQKGTLEYKYLEYLTDFKQYIESDILDGEKVGTAGIDQSAMKTRNIRGFVEEYFKDKELNATTEFALVSYIDKDNPNITPDAKFNAISKDLGVELDQAIYGQIWDRQSQRIEQAARTNGAALQAEADLAKLVIDNPVKRANLLLDGKSIDLGSMNNDLRIGTEVKARADKNALFEHKITDDKNESVFHARSKEELEERAKYLEYYQAWQENFVPRLFEAIDEKDQTKTAKTRVEDAAAKVETFEQLSRMCRVLGISPEQLRKEINRLAGKGENDEISSEFWKDIHSTIRQGSHSKDKTDKKTAKVFKDHFGKTKDNDKIPVDSQYFSQAVRNCIIENSHKHVDGNKNIKKTLEEEKNTLLVALTERGGWPFCKKNEKGEFVNKDAEGKPTDTEAGYTLAQKFTDDVINLADTQIPDVIFQMMQTNIKLQKDDLEGANQSDLIFSLLTSGSVDENIKDLEKQLRNKYKDQGIDFDKIKVKNFSSDKEGEESLSSYIYQMFARQANRSATAYMQDVAAKSKDKSKDGKKFNEDAGQLFDKKAVKEQTGVELEASKKSKGYSEPVSKCPYRALAMAMKMINQLAKMMCSSFQKTIGAGGFYNGLDQETFNEMMGFGQRFEERSNDLEWFFFGGEFKDGTLDKDGKPNEKKINKGFLQIGPKDEKFGELCQKLGINADENSLRKLMESDQSKVEIMMGALSIGDEKLKKLWSELGVNDEQSFNALIKSDSKKVETAMAALNPENDRLKKLWEELGVKDEKAFKDLIKKDPKKVEDALFSVKGLNAEYSDWIKKNGKDAQLDAAAKVEKANLAQEQKRLRLALERAKDDLKNNPKNNLYVQWENAEAEGNTAEAKRLEQEILKKYVGASLDEKKQEIKDKGDVATTFYDVEINRLNNLLEYGEQDLKVADQEAIKSDIEYLEDMKFAYVQASEARYSDEALESGVDLQTEAALRYIENKVEAIEEKIIKNIALGNAKEDGLTPDEKKLMSMSKDNDGEAVDEFITNGKSASYRGGTKVLTDKPKGSLTATLSFDDMMIETSNTFTKAGKAGGEVMKDLVSSVVNKDVNITEAKNFIDGAEWNPKDLGKFAESLRKMKEEAIKAANQRNKIGGKEDDK